MKYFVGFLLLGLSISGTAAFATNDNLDCFGVNQAFGTWSNMIDSGTPTGNLNLSNFSKVFVGAAVTENPAHTNQKLSTLSRQVVGVNQVATLRQDVSLNYDHGHLTSLDQRTYPDGQLGNVVTGKTISYAWKNGHCVPSKITVQNREQLGTATGVMFDSKLCDSLAGQKISAQDARACVETSRKALQVINDYDNQIRKDSKGSTYMVIDNPFAANTVTAMNRVPESSRAEALLSACAQVDLIANPPKAPNPPPTPARPAKAQKDKTSVPLMKPPGFGGVNAK